MNTAADPRIELLKQWLFSVLPNDQFELSPASSDASFRRYFRVQQARETWIVMDAPPEYEDIALFTRIDELLAANQIPVPRIFAQNLEQGFLLLSDLDSTSYLAALTPDNADLLYRRAIDSIVDMQKIAVAPTELPHYDRTLLQREMDLFSEWFLHTHLNITPPEWLTELYEHLLISATAQPQRFVHRDYHSRNLMLPNSDTIGIIDFQDAVIGPISYDLVSLLKDCYIQWPAVRRQQWIDYYLDSAISAGILVGSERSDFIRAFDWMGLQRHLKVLGIFCRLNYRDGKAGYMADLPLTLHYVLDVSQRYPEFSQLYRYLTDTPEIMSIL